MRTGLVHAASARPVTESGTARFHLSHDATLKQLAPECMPAYSVARLSEADLGLQLTSG